MKVEVEIPEEDAKWLEENWQVNVSKFAQAIITKSIQMGKEAIMAAKQGIPLTAEGVLNASIAIGQELAEETTKEDKQVE